MAFVALAASLTAIGSLLMRKINTGLAMIAGAVVLCIAGGMPVRELGGALAATLVDPTTVNLTLSVVLLGVLGHAMKLTGSLSRSVEALERLAGAGRLALVSVPALVSMLAVPGGAILSAPMVDELGRRQGLAPERLSALNILPYGAVIRLILPPTLAATAASYLGYLLFR